MKQRKLTFSERRKIIEYLFELARKQEFQENNFYVRERNSSYSEKRLTDILDSAISILSEESKRIIVNDFKIRTNKSWWQYFYARTTYYRLKDKATMEFLNYLKKG